LLVDYSGDPAQFVDRHTGEIIPAPLFLSVWAFKHSVLSNAA
jgi:hypothetical protein